MQLFRRNPIYAPTGPAERRDRPCPLLDKAGLGLKKRELRLPGFLQKKY